MAQVQDEITQELEAQLTEAFKAFQEEFTNNYKNLLDIDATSEENIKKFYELESQLFAKYFSQVIAEFTIKMTNASLRATLVRYRDRITDIRYNYIEEPSDTISIVSNRGGGGLDG